MAPALGPATVPLSLPDGAVEPRDMACALSLARFLVAFPDQALGSRKMATALARVTLPMASRDGAIEPSGVVMASTLPLGGPWYPLMYGESSCIFSTEQPKFQSSHNQLNHHAIQH
jgi:hypothetical protein